jgi:hypothetical protein
LALFSYWDLAAGATMRQVVREKVDEAIRLMDDAVARAKKEVARIASHEKHTDVEAINAVMSQFSQAFTQSLSQLECAYRRNEEALMEQRK